MLNLTDPRASNRLPNSTLEVLGKQIEIFCEAFLEVVIVELYKMVVIFGQGSQRERKCQPLFPQANILVRAHSPYVSSLDSTQGIEENSIQLVGKD